MAMPLPPWVRSLPFARRRRTAFVLLGLGWSICGLALWVHLGIGAWCVARRPTLIAEAFLADTSTPAQADDLAKHAQSQPCFCEVRQVSAEEARSEAAQDEHVRALVEVLGANPFLRSLRFSLCGAGMDGWAEAASWLRQQPGVASVKIPQTRLENVFETERILKRVATAGALAAGATGLAVACAALALLAAGLLGEFSVYVELGASVGKLWGRALWAVGAPSAILAALVGILLELGSVLARFSGAVREGPAAHLPDFPYQAGLLLEGVAILAGLLIATLVMVLRMMRRPG